MISTENNSKERPMDQDSDCWASLGQHIKTNSLQFLKRVLKTNRALKSPEGNGALKIIHGKHYLD